MHRFFVPPDCIDDDVITLSGPVARQLARVLRFRPGDRIVLLDDSNIEYYVTLTSVCSDRVRGFIIDRSPSEGEPVANLILYQSVLKADRFEFILQKGTELGVSKFVPTFCARSVPRERGNTWTTNRYTRWRRIITEAAEQSHRGRVPVLANPTLFTSACDGIDGLAIIPWEQESNMDLKTALTERKRDGQESSSVNIFIGPEGGFTSEEVDYARARGIVSVTLGKRVLRAETASIAAVVIILHEFGELEQSAANHHQRSNSETLSG